LYYSVFKSAQPERNSKTIGIIASWDFSDSRKPTADSPGLPDFRSPTSDFLAGFRLLASGLFGCGSAALCLFVAIQLRLPGFPFSVANAGREDSLAKAMSLFAPLPLGRRIPDLPHAVSVSIPTLSDLRGYEEKAPAVLSRMPSGYPRFVVHHLVRHLAEVLAKRSGLQARRLWLTSSHRVSEALRQHLANSQALLFSGEGVHGVSHPEAPELASRAKSFLQHTGGFLSSREAEDVLVRLGELPAPAPETVAQGDLLGAVWKALGPLFPKAGPTDAFFTSCGINAVYSAFKVASELQARRGRTIWVQLGWLYLDTIAILRELSPSPGGYRLIRHVDDKQSLERLFAEEGGRIAGVIAEVPTNPLIQTPDVPWLAEITRKYEATLILDPSVASAYSVNLLPYADILVTSLTKYSGHDGDVLAGLAVVNPLGTDAAEFRRGLAGYIEPIYHRELARLVAQLESAPYRLDVMEENLWRTVEYLESRPEVSAVHWAQATRTRDAFKAVARFPFSVGGMLSFELKVPMERFYDAVRLPKGPSFGMNNSLLCPFIWLGHYDLVNSVEGREELAASGINPDLLRLSVGTEAPEDIIGALDEAFDAAGRI
jgi:cystathionine gamma-synthase